MRQLYVQRILSNLECSEKNKKKISVMGKNDNQKKDHKL